MLAVYTGTAVSALTLVASNDNTGGNLTSLVTFQAQAGSTYQIAVDGFGGGSGNILLNVRAIEQAITLRELGQWPGYRRGGPAQRVAVVGNYAHVADGSAGLQIIDIRNPADAVWVGGYNTGSYANGVALSATMPTWRTRMRDCRS